MCSENSPVKAPWEKATWKGSGRGDTSDQRLKKENKHLQKRKSVRSRGKSQLKTKKQTKAGETMKKRRGKEIKRAHSKET